MLFYSLPGLSSGDRGTLDSMSVTWCLYLGVKFAPCKVIISLRQNLRLRSISYEESSYQGFEITGQVISGDWLVSWPLGTAGTDILI